MMKIYNFTRKSLIALVFVLLTSAFQSLMAQDTTFQVLVVDGNVHVKKAELWQPLNAGQLISRGDLIRVDKDAYVGMTHYTGHTLEIRKNGTYEAEQLSRKISQEKLKVASRYASFYVSMLNDSMPKKINTLERSASQGGLNVYLPNSVDVFNDEVVIRWKDETALNETYEVRLKNMFDEVLDVQEVGGTKTRLNFNNEKIAKERLIIVSVNNKASKDQKSGDYGMKQLTPEEAEPIAQELNELKLEITGQQTALDKLILASFYEQNSLLADALTSYENAISLAPDVEAFRKAYDQFIFRNGLGY